MDNPIERVRISQTAAEQLVKLKRSTRIKQWNTLCRWAFCLSLAENSPPSPVPIKTDSNVEIAWNVFGGEIANILFIALVQRCHQDGLGIEPDVLKQQFTLHLHRGIGYLAGNSNILEIEDLVDLNAAVLK